jgi:hypothetical protein
MELEAVKSNKLRIFFNNFGKNLVFIGFILLVCLGICVCVAAFIGFMYLMYSLFEYSKLLGIGVIVFAIFIAIVIGTAIKGEFFP